MSRSHMAPFKFEANSGPFASFSSIEIYPRIGIARVGNSENEWFYGPEIPGRVDTPVGGFKDAQGAIKRQAARFRVYGHKTDGTVVELNQSNGFTLEWSLEVANQKAAWYTFQNRTSGDENPWKPGSTTLRNPDVQGDISPPNKRSDLVISSGVQHVGGSHPGHALLSGKFTGSNKKTTTIYLGDARLDNEGRLVVLPGRGDSRSVLDKDTPYPLILTDFDSSDWIDDTSDGWITVTVKKSGAQVDVPHKARVVCSTPKFSTAIYAPTSLYDLMENIYESEKRAKPEYKLEVEWYQHIWPLLQRPSLLSWVNGQANEGHGLTGPGNFFEEKWQNLLKDPSPENEPIRKGVLGRMRLPDIEKYRKARAGQAYWYFMPWLSGDNGRVTDGDITTFAAVTELQYDRLVQWSKGEFTVADPLPVYTRFEDIPLKLQPDALTKASLEPTIGAPLYPGIEMSWNAEVKANYQLDVPFSMNDELEPGDLTKYLSLPWQSDFYMCRSYWWPSARPDAIVTEKEYERVTSLKSTAPDKEKKIQRVPWERGLRQNYTDVYSDQPLFANTDMAEYWHQLGFVVNKNATIDPSGLPVFVETERHDIHPKGHTGISKPNQIPIPRHGGITMPPKPNNGIKTVESLREHLRAAMAVELSTIPLYLFGMYTIKIPKDYVDDPRYIDPYIHAVRDVVAEEMLHLSLAGNVLKAVGGTPKLYDPPMIPKYPGKMLGRIPDLEFHLWPIKKNIDTYIAVEKPEAPDAKPEADTYHTLGQFYHAIEDGLKYLNNLDPKIHLFSPGTAEYQFAPGLGYQPRKRDAGGSVIVTDLATALTALKIIVDQGEGNPGPYVDPDHLEKDHYAIFEGLKARSKQWEDYHVIDDPTTSGYELTDDKLYRVSRTFDAAYCFLLLTIEKLWTIKDDDSRKQLVLGNMFTVMMGVLGPLAKYLIQQPFGGGDQVAAPCFDYYHFESGSSELSQLQAEMQNALNGYLDVTDETPDQVVVHNYGPQLELLLPIQATMASLLDLDTFVPLQTPVIKKTVAGVQNRAAKGFGKLVL